MSAQEIEHARRLEREAAAAQREGRYADAEAPLEGAIAIWTRLRGADDVEALNDQMNLAVAYRRRGEAARAVPLLERVVALLPKTSDPDVPSLLLTARNNLATAYRGIGELGRAREAWETCLVGLDAMHGATRHPERARVLDNLAVVLRDLRDFVASEAYARRGLAEWRALRPDGDPDVATSKATLGAALMEQKKVAEAAPLIVEALRVHQQAGNDLAVASTLTLLGACSLAVGNREDARAMFTKALALTRRFYPDTHPEVRELLASLAAIG